MFRAREHIRKHLTSTLRDPVDPDEGEMGTVEVTVGVFEVFKSRGGEGRVEGCLKNGCRRFLLFETSLSDSTMGPRTPMAS